MAHMSGPAWRNPEAFANKVGSGGPIARASAEHKAVMEALNKGASGPEANKAGLRARDTWDKQQASTHASVQAQQHNHTPAKQAAASKATGGADNRNRDDHGRFA